MSKPRVSRKLAEWATLDDSTLEKRIEAIEGKRPPTAKIQEARRLFAARLETPGGLKIHDDSCLLRALLHQFPLEANVAGHFFRSRRLRSGGAARRRPQGSLDPTAAASTGNWRSLRHSLDLATIPA